MFSNIVGDEVTRLKSAENGRHPTQVRASLPRLLQFITPVLCLISVVVRADPGPLTLWYTTPGVPGNATSWQHEALPVGNGKLAAMVYGGVGSEQIQFNEDTV